jgi:hypothetical protein
MSQNHGKRTGIHVDLETSRKETDALVRSDIRSQALIRPYPNFQRVQLSVSRKRPASSRCLLSPPSLSLFLSLSRCLIHKHMSQVTRVQRSRMRSIIALAIIAVMFAAVAAQDDYIHLPGKSCQDAPACPDGRPCVMAPPRCNRGTCGTNPVPTCGKKA